MRVKEFMWRFCIECCNDDNIGYTNDWPNNQWWRPPDLDCGSFMSYILHMGLLKIGINTGYRYFEPMGKDGYYGLDFLREYCDQYDYHETYNEPADILVSSGHTEMFLPDHKMGGARNDYDGRPGDGSGREVAISDFRDNNWIYIFRLKDKYNLEIETGGLDMSRIPICRLGDENNTVMSYQYIMRYKLGFDKQKVTGVFDEQMEFNVKFFQEEHQLEKDGVIGEYTGYEMIVRCGYEEP